MKILAAAVAALFFASGAMAAPPAAPGASGQAAPKRSVTDINRPQLLKELDAKWAREAEARGMSAAEWDELLTGLAGKADPMNLLSAVEMPTFQLMTGALSGQSLDSEGMRQALGEDGTNALGSVGADLTYTPLPAGRCRVADSRVIASPLVGTVTRAIDTEDTASYASQGGNGSTAGDGSTNCGLPSFVDALAISVSVITRGNGGFFKIFENSQPFATGSTVQYEPGVSASNDVIVKSCKTCALELSVYANTNVDYVIDVLGYFTTPEATALECVTETFVSGLIVSGSRSFTTVSCPVGYTVTGGGAETGTNLNSYLNASRSNGNGWFSSIQNGSGTDKTYTHSAVCCRVPGR